MPGVVDLDELSELISLVYDSALEPDQWSRLCARILQMFPGHVSLIQTFEAERALGVYSPIGFNRNAISAFLDAEDGGEPPPQSEESFEYRRELLRRITPVLGIVRQSRDIFTEEEFRSGARYKELSEPAGIGHWTSVLFAVSGPRFAAMVFAENERDPVCKDGAGLARLLDLLGPHIVRGARIARALYMAKEAAETYRGFLDAIALPMRVIDAARIVQIANTAGQRLLERGALLRADAAGRLRLVDGRSDRDLGRCLERLRSDASPLGLQIEDDERYVSVCIAPFHPAMQVDLRTEKDVFRNQRLFALFFGTDAAGLVHPGLLQDVFGLSLREAEVCSALASGLNPAQISLDFGRAEKTVRNQIQAVYDKVGVSSHRSLIEALSVFRAVGAMFDGGEARAGRIARPGL